MIGRVLFLWSLALALAVRVAVPSGWMPVVGESGSLSLAPCPAATPRTMAPDAGHHSPDSTHLAHSTHSDRSDQSDQHAPQPDTGGDCAFAPLQASVLLAALGNELLPGILAIAPASPRRQRLYAPTGPPAPPPPSTGPPAAA